MVGQAQFGYSAANQYSYFGGGPDKREFAVPVTARLSKKLYDTLGEDVAQELVDWFNQVDATYRGDLKDLNELNFSRFDAKLEQRTVELVALIDRRYSALDAKIDQRYGELDAKIDQRHGELDAKIDQRYRDLDAKIDRVYGELDAKIDRVYGELDAKIDRQGVDLRAEIQRVEDRLVSGFAEADERLERRLAGVRAELIKWMFVIVVGTGLAAVAAVSRLVG